MKFKVPQTSKYLLIYGCLTDICDGDPCIGGVLQILNSMKCDDNGVIETNSGVIAEWSQGLLSRRKAEESIKWLVKAEYISRQLRPGLDPLFSLNCELIESRVLGTKNVGTQEKLPTKNVGTPYEKCIPLPTKNVGTPHKKCRDFDAENSPQEYENKDTYENFSDSLIKGSKLEVKGSKENQEENTYNGSVCTTPLTAVATAPLTSVAYAPSLAIDKENFQESAIETTSAIITTSTPHIGHEVGKMNTTDVLTEIFIKYAKVPEKKRDAKCKGSASRLMQNWGDRIKSVVDEVGEEALVAMDNFIRDEYWLAKGLPLPAFKSQFRKYLNSEEPESDDQSEIQTSAKPARKFQASSGSSYQPSQFAYTDHHPIAVFSLQDQSGATLRKREALDILQQVGGDLEAEGRAEIGFKIDPSMYSAVEEWHSKALQAYKSIKNRDYPVLTEPIKGVLNA